MNKNRMIAFSAHDKEVFSKYGVDKDSLKNLMVDLALGKAIFDAEGNEISKREANDTLRQMNKDFFGLGDTWTHRDLKRGMEDYGKAWFRILEEVEDIYIDYGMRTNELFNQLVNMKSRAVGDDNLFYVPEDDLILSVAEVGTSHHDFSLQRLGVGATYSVPVKRYGAAVGMELNRYFAGQEDWEKLVATLGNSFIIKQQIMIYNLLQNAATKIPVQTGFVESGALSAATKEAFDDVIYNVSLANGGAQCVIVATKPAIKQLTKLADVDWISNGMKDDVANMGRLGNYEGTLIYEVPNRFADKTLTDKLYDDKKILIFAQGVDNRICDFFTFGETSIDEITEKGEANGRIDDLGKYEIQMAWGAEVRVRRQFGQWTLV